MAAIRQPSFAGGEIDPKLRGRSDLEKRAVALRRLRDFFVSKTGAAVSRPGTEYCGATKSNGVARLVPFVYSDTQTYVLEFTDLKVRFWSDGALVGAPYEVTTPYAAADLDRLAWAQSGDVLTLVHPSYAPRELARLAHTNWTLTTLDFDVPAVGITPYLIQRPIRWLDEGDTNHISRKWTYQITEVFRDDRGIVYETAPYTIAFAALPYYQDWRDNFTYALATRVTGTALSGAGTAGVRYRSIQANNRNHLLTDAAWWVADATGTTPIPNQLDAVPETIVFDTDAPLRPATVRLFDPAGLASVDPNFITRRIYRGRQGLYGWLADERGAEYFDDGREPDFTIQPPQGRNPFKTFDATGALTRTDYPATVCFFEGRRLFGGMSGKPGWIYASAQGDWANFDQHQLANASDEVELELASRKREDVRHLVGLDQLVALTNSSAWAIRGPGGDPLTAAGVNGARVQAEVGSSWVPPIVIGQAVLFLRTKGVGVRELTYDVRAQGYVPSDLSLMSQHFFDGFTVVDWAYAEDPWSVIWAVRSDGALLSLSYLREQDVWAWALHTVAAGAVEAVCSVPEGDEDAVYLVVNRTISGSTVRYVERLTSRVDLTAFRPYDAAISSEHTVLLWRLDEASGTAAAADAMGSYPLTTVSGTPTVIAGHRNSARKFGGAAYLTGPADAGTVALIKSGEWSLRGWVAIDSAPGSGDDLGILMLANSDGTGRQLYLKYWTSGGLYLGFDAGNIGGCELQLTGASVLHHLIITCALAGGNRTIKIYRDTTLHSTTAIVASAAATASPTWFLGRGYNGAAINSGKVTWDEVALFNRVLTPAEISADFAGSAPFGTVSGLAHLNGESVYVLADDVEQGPFTVAAGSVTLTTPALTAQAGLRFQPELETLDLAIPTAELRTKPKTVTQVGFEVEVPNGQVAAVSVGQNLTHLQPATADAVLDTDDEDLEHLLANVNVDATWGIGGRAALRVTGPRPVTVTGITREVQVGGE